MMNMSQLVLSSDKVVPSSSGCFPKFMVPLTILFESTTGADKHLHPALLKESSVCYHHLWK